MKNIYVPFVMGVCLSIQEANDREKAKEVKKCTYIPLVFVSKFGSGT